jgi:hypothetical protein
MSAIKALLRYVVLELRLSDTDSAQRIPKIIDTLAVAV